MRKRKHGQRCGYQPTETIHLRSDCFFILIQCCYFLFSDFVTLNRMSMSKLRARQVLYSACSRGGYWLSLARTCVWAGGGERRGWTVLIAHRKLSGRSHLPPVTAVLADAAEVRSVMSDDEGCSVCLRRWGRTGSVILYPHDLIKQAMFVSAWGTPDSVHFYSGYRASPSIVRSCGAVWWYTLCNSRQSDS